MFCVHCGKEVKENSCFCTSCGKEINNKLEGTSRNGSRKRDLGLGACVLVIIAIATFLPYLFNKEELVIENANVQIYPGKNKNITLFNKILKEDESITEAVEEKNNKTIMKKSQIIYYCEDGTTSNMDYTYDEYGNVVSEIYTYQNDDESVGKYGYFYSYDYDDRGNILAKYTYGEDGELYTEETYTEYGDFLTITNYGTTGNEVTKWEYIYDAEGKIQESSRYHTYNSATESLELQGKSTYIYNKDGLLESRTEYSIYSSETQEYYEYDENAKLTLSYTVNNETGEILSKIEYDPAKKTETYYIKLCDSETFWKTQYVEHNIYGDLLVYKEYDEDGNETYSSLYMYDYVTDNNGNIIEKATYEYGYLMTEEFREYY